MMSVQPPSDPTFQAALGAASFAPAHVALRAELADAGRAGDFATVLRILKRGDVTSASWRLGGSSWFTPLHQAAWHGAAVEVVEQIRGYGGFLLQPDAAGKVPADFGRTTSSPPAGAGWLADRGSYT